MSEHVADEFGDRQRGIRRLLRQARDASDGCFFFSSRRRHTRCSRDWSSDVCSSDLAMLPDAGGSYVYVREAFGPLPAFLVGWTLFLAINTGGTATLAVAFANYLGELVPLAPTVHKLAGVAMIAAVAAVNIRGVRHAATVQNSSTALKVGAILALAAAGFVLGDGFHGADVRAFTTPL